MGWTLLIFLLYAIPASKIDIKQKRLPDVFTLPGGAVLLLITFVTERAFLPEALLAALLLPLFLLIIKRVSKGLGEGDIKFSISIGVLCGLIGSYIALAIASLTALLFFAVLFKFKKIDLRTRIPFGPFLTGGAILAKIVVSLW